MTRLRARRTEHSASVRRDLQDSFLDSAKRKAYDTHANLNARSISMAHKKVERAKELDRRRHRRAKRLKERVKEAKAAK